MSSTYWCCIITRDGADTLRATIESIMHQSAPPEFLILVNDGSIDDTANIILEKSERYGRIHAISTQSKTRDIRRVPALLNMGMEQAKKFQRTTYMMVSGDDNELTPEYAEAIMRRMDENPKIAVASGDWIDSPGRSNQMPHGGGRFVRMDIMERIGGKYPVAYGWEPWLLYKAMQLGYKVKLYPDQRYSHLRPYQTKNLFGWGRAMYSLGFPLYFVLLRFLINFFWTRRSAQSRKASVSMLAGFLSAKISPETLRGLSIQDEPLKSFVRLYSSKRLTSVL